MTGALVVGAGPAGLIAAKQIASSGHEVHVFEEHSRVGEPRHCAGLISAEGLRRIGLETDPRFTQSEIYGGRVYSPDGTCIEVRDRRVRAYAVNRVELDRTLAEQAEAAGAEIHVNTRAEGLLLNGVVRGVRAGETSYEGLVVDAEGSGRRLLRAANLYTANSTPLIGVNVDLDVRVEEGVVELWFGESVSPGLFAWVIPTGSGARVGLTSNRGDAIERLSAFLKRRFGSTNRIHLHAGVVLTDPPLTRTSFENLLLVGDAAGHTKATTGGGVVLGGLCAMEAGRVTVEALNKGDHSAKLLSRYDRAWKRKYGSEFTSMHRLRRLLNGVGDETLSRAFRAVKEEGLDNELLHLVEKGDMDLQGGVIKKALASPRVAALLLRVAGKVALGELGDLINV